MSADETTPPAVRAIEADQDGAAFPERRSPDNVPADEDSLYRELTAVCDRHDGDLTHETITRALFDFADSYAEVNDVARRVEFRHAPDHIQPADEVPLVIVEGADGELAPIGWTLTGVKTQ